MIKVEVDGKERTKVIKLSLLLIGLEKHEKCISDFFEGRSNVKIFFSMLLRAFQDSASRAHSKKKFVKFFDFSFLANFPLFPFTHS